MDRQLVHIAKMEMTTREMFLMMGFSVMIF